MPQFPSALALSTLNGANGLRIIGTGEAEYAGYAVSSAGDVNGDGFADIIVSAPQPIVGSSSYEGASYVIFGKAGGFTSPLNVAALDGSDGFQIVGSIYTRGPGSVASAGDINGDGFDDVIAGGYFSGGGMHVVFGKAAGFAASIDQADLDGTDGFRITGAGAYDLAGTSVSGAGDVNGDGLSDFIIGAPAFTTPSETGASYVVFGQASGFGADFDLATLDGDNGFKISGEAAGDENGRSVASAGDVNGDGFDDVIVGARGADPNGSFSGASYVVFGKASGFTGNLNLASLNGGNGFQINGVAAGDEAGEAVDSAGDINGDGFDDLIIGARNADPNGSNSGACYVVFGKGSAFTANLNLAGLNGTNGFRIDGIVADDSLGNAVSGAGDVNGDGFDDLIVGAPSAYDFVDPGAGSAGRAYVVFGKASGFGAAFDVTSLNGDNGFRLDPPLARAMLGWSVSEAGDINGDGFDDITVGGFRGYSVDYGDGEAQAYTVFGAKPTDAVVRTGSAIGQTINGGLGADTLSGLGGDDELIGHESNDTLNGGSGNDTLNGGSGSDTMAGGTGNDLYFVTAAGDTVSELASQGTDEVRTSRDYTLGANVENLSMIGGGAIDGTGNGAGNTMTGNGAANTLTGLGGSDRLDGKGGADTLIGGAANDIYFVDTASDDIVELAGAGTDQARSSVSFTIGNLVHVENLLLTGSGATNGVGNAGANSIIGGSGNNTLNGAAGDDTINGGFGRDILIGGTGADSFVYFNNAAQSGPAPNTRDRINDLVSGTDEIDLSPMDANLLAAGNQAFAIDTNGSFSTGEIKIEDIGADLLLSFNIDADAAAEMQIQLRNIDSIGAGDFVL